MNSDLPHRRLNILTGEWILVSPHRAKRPWQGQVEKISSIKLPAHDPGCYLCPGNTRAGRAVNPAYTSTFVFDNDFSALLPQIADDDLNRSNLLVAKNESGICRVVCFSPHHNLTLPEMDSGAIRRVVETWTDEYLTLGARQDINYVQIFENKGAAMGCSNPHPHGQIWAQRSIPVEPSKEHRKCAEYFHQHRSCLLCDYIKMELEEKVRIVDENEDFVGLVPFWAVWPFETMIVSKRHSGSLSALSDSERQSFADMIKNITTRYDNLFETSFPYSSGIHQQPTDGTNAPGIHMHMHFYPPLLRSASIKKFMVGYEMMANPQRDITAEFSAERLCSCSKIHFSKKK